MWSNLGLPWTLLHFSPVHENFAYWEMMMSINVLTLFATSTTSNTWTMKSSSGTTVYFEKNKHKWVLSLICNRCENVLFLFFNTHEGFWNENWQNSMGASILYMFKMRPIRRINTVWKVLSSSQSLLILNLCLR